jgi:hypothetical protein
MPRIFRSMARDGDLPLVAPAGDALGVRVAPHPCHTAPCRDDVHPDEHGVISPMSGAHPEQCGAPRAEGLSVQPDWRVIPPHRIPKRLRHLAREARGPNKLFCWEMGTGPFVPTVLGEALLLHPDKPDHGVAAPATPIHVDEYQRHLAATRGSWTIIQEDPLR